MMPNPCTALYFKEKGLLNGMSINIFNYMRKSENFPQNVKRFGFYVLIWKNRKANILRFLLTLFFSGKKSTAKPEIN